MIHNDLTEQQLIAICHHIQLSHPQTIANNQWCFMQYHMQMPLVWQSFIIEFTNPYIKDMNYRQRLHILCSEVYQSQQN